MKLAGLVFFAEGDEEIHMGETTWNGQRRNTKKWN
jgi:hypothetical protein